MHTLLDLSTLQNLLAVSIPFVIGLLIKTKIQWGKTNTDVLNTLTADYKAMKSLYEAKIDEIKRKNEVAVAQSREILELRARIKSYEDFLQTRVPETDLMLKQLPGLLSAIAEHLQVPYVSDSLTGLAAAHTQAEKHAFDEKTKEEQN